MRIRHDGEPDGRGRHRESFPETPEYRSWRTMKRRCLNAHDDAYARYGGAGICVCPRWLTYENFLADMGRRPSPAHTLDRFPDPNGHYELGNCRWATWLEQNRNRRNSVRLVINGCSQLLQEWADQVGLNYTTIQERLKRGWSPERAVFTPVGVVTRWTPAPGVAAEDEVD